MRPRSRPRVVDCFAIATARRYEAPLWTGDPEIIELADPSEIVDLR
jgi:hypothetical protein